ncbi:MAG: exonuclease SbcCD subunit D [Eubacteriales bacterium]|nr:exonuclease SbcCD subunit D [Eubacteriales bacterium]
MRFIHLADLHIGKKVNGFSMLEDQRYILEQVLSLIEEEKKGEKDIDGVLIAGDVYDKTVPTTEAVQLLDWFLTELVAQNMPVYIVSGNHDSGERLSFAANLLKTSGVFLTSVYDGKMEPIRLKDAYGPLCLYLLPFIKPAHVKKAFDLDELGSYQEAMETVFEHANMDTNVRNVLVAHQMVTGASRCDSEEVSVGGLDNIDSEVFDAFDYVALGHLHGPQRVGRDEVRYAGTLLKYSFSECHHKKSVTIVELLEKGKVVIETRELKPIRDMREITGLYEDLMKKSFYEGNNQNDYISVVLTDELEVPDAFYRLRTVYPNMMKLEYNNRRTKMMKTMEQADLDDNKQPMDYVRELYVSQNNQDMTETQEQLIQEMIERIWG